MNFDAATITGAFGLAGIALGGAVKYLTDRKLLEIQGELDRAKAQLENAHSAIDAERNVMRFEHDFAIHGSLHARFRQLCKETEIDRIFFFVAWNGKESPQWTKGVWHYRYGDQLEEEFIHVPLDDDYRYRLIQTFKHPEGVTFVVDDIPEDVLIGGIYRVENLGASMWVPVRKMEHEHGSSYSYFSFATHAETTVSPTTKLRIRLMVDEVRGYATETSKTVI